MCKNYPHGRMCEFPGCTWSKEDQLIHNTVEDTMRVSKYFLKHKPEKDLGIEIVPGVRKRKRQEIEKYKLEEPEVTEEMIKEYMEQSNLNFCGYMPTSSMEGKNIHEAFEVLVRLLLKNKE